MRPTFFPALVAVLAGCADATVPPDDPDAEVDFLNDGDYVRGRDVLVRIQNTGDAPYEYRLLWPACAVRFFDDGGREFRVPTGLDCTATGMATIAPGESVNWFQWGLTECVRPEATACAQSKPLDPGTYHLRADFTSADGQRTSRAGATIRVI